MNDQTQLQWRPNPTKQYTARITQDVWEHHKDAIITQYETSTLDKTRLWMRDDLSLNPSENQLRRQLQKWSIFKYKTGPTGYSDGSRIASTLATVEHHDDSYSAASPEPSNSPTMQEAGVKRKACLSSPEQAIKRLTLLGPTRSNAIRVRHTECQSRHQPSIGSGQAVIVKGKLSYESIPSARENLDQISPLAESNCHAPNHTDQNNSGSQKLDQNSDNSATEDLTAVEDWEVSTLDPREPAESTDADSSPETRHSNRSPLMIDPAAPATSWLPADLERVRHAADFLFSCGSLEDAFPLYVLLWKQLDDSTASVLLRHSIVLSCQRSASTEMHMSILENLLEKELDMERDLSSLHHGGPEYAISFTSLFRLLLAAIQSLRKDENPCNKNFKLASKWFSTMDSLVTTFIELRTHNINRIRPETPFHDYPKSWMPESIAPDAIEFNSSLTMPSRDRQVFKARNRILQHHLPLLLSSSAFFDYDIFGVLKWCKALISTPILNASTIWKLSKRFRQHKFHPEIALASHLWESWQRCKLSSQDQDGKNEKDLEKLSVPLESSIGPRTVGVDSVSIAEVLIVISSLLLGEKLSRIEAVLRKDTFGFDEEMFPSIISANHTKLIDLDTNVLHEKFRKRHLLLIDRQRNHAESESRQESQQQLRRLVESCLNIALPEAPPCPAPRSWKTAPTLLGRPIRSNVGPTLAKSLHPSEDSSFRKFAGTACRAMTSQFSQASSKSTMPANTCTRSSNRPLLFLTDRLSLSMRSLSISDSAQIVFLDLSEIPGSPEEET